MKVVFSDLSRKRLHEIQAYIAFDNIRAAVKVIDRIIYTAELLGDHPDLGTLWQGGPTRALAVSGLRYRIHYMVDANKGEVAIITVAHTSQLPPELGKR
jgi:plasmid stabilization system protein ParE